MKVLLDTHALHVSTLPDHHRDPFDRMLVAQSQLERLTILGDDPLIARYDVICRILSIIAGEGGDATAATS